jgi:hypothetical protein
MLLDLRGDVGIQILLTHTPLLQANFESREFSTLDQSRHHINMAVEKFRDLRSGKDFVHCYTLLLPPWLHGGRDLNAPRLLEFTAPVRSCRLRERAADLRLFHPAAGKSRQRTLDRDHVVHDWNR